MNGFTSFDDHFAECPTNGSFADFVHTLEVLFGFQAFLFRSVLCFGVEVGGEGIVSAWIDEAGYADAVVEDVGDPSSFEALHLKARQLDLITSQSTTPNEG